MIYTVTLNPSLDYIIGVNNFFPTKTNRTTYEKIFPGGKGINVSLVLNNLGLKSKALGFTAGFTGNEIKRLLDNENIDYDFVLVNNGTSRINVKIKNLDLDGKVIDEAEINGKGPLISKSEINLFYSLLNKIKEDDILVLAGNIPESLSKDIYLDILCRINKNVKVVIDTTKDYLINALKYKPFLIKPNKEELEEIVNSKIDTYDDIVYYSKKLRQLGAQNVLTSLGGNGAVLVTSDNKIYKTLSPKGKLINSVGAGDSLVAGFIYGYLLDNNYENALKYGVCAGSASAFSDRLATKKDVLNLMKQV